MSFLLPFAVALGVTAVLTPVMRRLAWAMGVVAHPRADRWNRSAVALLGGIPIWISCVGVTAVFGGASFGLLLIGGGITAALLVGLIDDLIVIKPSTKLSAQLVIACAVIVAGSHMQATTPSPTQALIAIAWFLGVTNAFNLLDNMDGLCAGIAAIAGASFCAIINSSDPALFAFAATLSGAAVGFLFFNFAPASIFLGDAGSLFFGSSFALLALQYSPEVQTPLLATLAVPVLILLLPIFDTAFVTVARKLSARSASRGGRDHPSHRLVALGFTERQTVLVLYALAGAGGAVGWGISRHNTEAVALGLLLLVGLGIFALQLARVRVYDGDDFTLLKDRSFTPLLLEITYKRRVFEVVLDATLVATAYYFAYVLRFADEFRALYYGLFAASLPIVLACQISGLFLAGVYRGVWRYISITDIPTYVGGVLLGWLASVLTIVYLYRFEGYSRGVFMIHAMLLVLLLVGSRLLFRWLGEQSAVRRQTGRRAIVYGAGDAGILAVRELRGNPSHGCHPVAFLDDDTAKRHRRILGIPVAGGLAEIERVLADHGATLVVVSTRKLPPAVHARLQTLAREIGLRIATFDVRFEGLPADEGSAAAGELAAPDLPEMVGQGR